MRSIKIAIESLDPVQSVVGAQSDPKAEGSGFQDLLAKLLAAEPESISRQTDKKQIKASMHELLFVLAARELEPADPEGTAVTDNAVLQQLALLLALSRNPEPALKAGESELIADALSSVIGNAAAVPARHSQPMAEQAGVPVQPREAFPQSQVETEAEFEEGPTGTAGETEQPSSWETAVPSDAGLVKTQTGPSDQERALREQAANFAGEKDRSAIEEPVKNRDREEPSPAAEPQQPAAENAVSTAYRNLKNAMRNNGLAPGSDGPRQLEAEKDLPISALKPDPKGLPAVELDEKSRPGSALGLEAVTDDLLEAERDAFISSDTTPEAAARTEPEQETVPREVPAPPKEADMDGRLGIEQIQPDQAHAGKEQDVPSGAARENHSGVASTGADHSREEKTVKVDGKFRTEPAVKAPDLNAGVEATRETGDLQQNASIAESAGFANQMRETIMAQLVEHMRVQLNGHEPQVDIRLKPEYLGEVRITLTVRNGLVSAEITAQNPFASEIIQAAIPELRLNLQQLGVDLGEVNVGCGSQEQQSGFTGERRHFDRQSRFEVKLEKLNLGVNQDSLLKVNLRV